jgi:hypothetical protein
LVIQIRFTFLGGQPGGREEVGDQEREVAARPGPEDDRGLDGEQPEGDEQDRGEGRDGVPGEPPEGLAGGERAAAG